MKGQALVELAISMVFIMLLLVGVVEFGLAFFQFVQLRDAAQEGGLNGAICQDNERIYQRVVSSSDVPIDLRNNPDVLVDIAYSNTPPREGDGVTVTVSYRHKVFMPFLPAIVGEYLNLNASVTDTILTTGGC